MKTRRFWMVLGAATILLAPGCRKPQTETGSTPEPTAAETGAANTGEVKSLTATLTGAEEVPGPGDEDGSGEAKITLDPAASEICFIIEVKDIAAATASHIHSGAKGVAGDIVVTFDPPASGRLGCVDVEASLLESISDQPSNFYVNVHNAEFKAGAVRGQLS